MKGYCWYGIDDKNAIKSIDLDAPSLELISSQWCFDPDEINACQEIFSHGLGDR
jgi:hypothetical protein